MNFGLILRFSLDNPFSPPYNYFINGTLQEKEDFMPSLILNELAQTAARLPHHPAVIDEAGTLSWQALYAKAQSISTALAKQVPPRRPICVFAEKSTEALVAFFGIVERRLLLYLSCPGAARRKACANCKFPCPRPHSDNRCTASPRGRAVRKDPCMRNQRPLLRLRRLRLA